MARWPALPHVLSKVLPTWPKRTQTAIAIRGLKPWQVARFLDSGSSYISSPAAVGVQVGQPETSHLKLNLTFLTSAVTGQGSRKSNALQIIEPHSVPERKVAASLLGLAGQWNMYHDRYPTRPMP